jgi:hypothetical protein
VVAPPLGATIYETPEGYTVRTINGVTYYVDVESGIYYRKSYIGGRVGFVVVGKP